MMSMARKLRHRDIYNSQSKMGDTWKQILKYPDLYFVKDDGEPPKCPHTLRQ
jgi:hypothetical protein